MVDPLKPRRMSAALAAKKLAAAAKLLRAIHEGGYDLYLDESWHINVMRGPSHTRGGSPRQEAIVCSETVPGFSGGAW